MRNLTFTYYFRAHVHIVLTDADGAVTFVGTAPYRVNVATANARIAAANRAETPGGVVRD